MPRWLAWAAAVVAVGAAAAARADALPPLAVEQIAPGVYVHTGAVAAWGPGSDGDVANVGFIVGDRCVAVIDSGGGIDVGRRLRAAVERTTPLPICAVVNTHAHPDHVLGNAAFVDAPGGSSPAIVAHAALPKALAERERHYLNALQRDFGVAAGPGTIVYPTRTIDAPTELDLGNRVLLLRPWPTAHTNNDLSVYDRTTRTLFTGDLLFVRHMPVVDGNLRGWVAALDELRRLDVARVVPGHGAPGADLAAMIAPQATYLEALLRETRAAVKAGVPIQRAVDEVGRDIAKPWALAELFHRRNVTAAYAELEWED
ncbi:quinoprotein relay system zinc metallohydrolase 2 [Azohydromonas sediminis]|uniref:quinoprotein relay system zinc metallohydrolase 2 n=1 Tax=Azohydromonas sediminis TaxID=2259674 RepID=UPI000E655ACB|nr:quinoprotein relay system zinc metallohydrolase 2 [Azohydromonas sediminis]